MKIKQSNDKISLREMPVVFFIAAVVSVICRTLQMFMFIDHETGFYTGGSVSSVALYAVLAVASIYFIVASFLSAESRKTDFCLEKNSALNAVTVIFSVSFLYDGISSFFSSFMSVGTQSAATAFQSMMLSGTIPLFFRSIFAFLSAIYFMLLAKSFIKCDGKFSGHKILAVAPVGWAGFRIIHRFIEQISYVKVSELLLELILLAFMIMFFMAFAQTASGVYSDVYRWRVTGFGLSAALVALTLNCARLICVFLKGADMLNGKYPFSVTDFIFAIFAVILIKAVITESKTKEIEEE